MSRLRHAMDRALAAGVSVLLAVMVLNVLWQVFTRFVLRAPSAYTEELARYLMIWAGLLGAALAAGRKAHLALDLLPAQLPPRAQRFAAFLIHLVVLTFALAVLVGGGARLVWVTLTLGQTSAALGWKLGYIYLGVPLSGMCIALYSAIEAIEALKVPGAAVRAGPAPQEEFYE